MNFGRYKQLLFQITSTANIVLKRSLLEWENDCLRLLPSHWNQVYHRGVFIFQKLLKEKLSLAISDRKIFGEEQSTYQAFYPSLISIIRTIEAMEEKLARLQVITLLFAKACVSIWVWGGECGGVCTGATGVVTRIAKVSTPPGFGLSSVLNWKRRWIFVPTCWILISSKRPNR